jgi:hypothetical protein
MNQKVLTVLFVATSIATLSTVAAHAALSVSTQGSPPTGPGVLLASPAPAGPGSYLMTHGTGMAVGVGQTFRFDRVAELDRITVLLEPLTLEVPGDEVTLLVTTFDGVADVTPDAMLYSGVAALPTSLEVGESAYVVFDLDDLTLDAGHQYGFMIEFAGGGNVNDARAEIANTATDTYAAGRPFLVESGKDGTVYEAMSADLVFYLEGVMEDPPDECEDPSAGPALATSELPGFRFWVRFGDPLLSTWWGAKEPLCMPETLCVSGALPGRTEVLLRVVGPKPNGYLWPTLVKLSTSRVDVWIEQVATGVTKCYVLEGAEPGSSSLEGLFDRTGFLP